MNPFIRRANKNSGFTLIELMIAIVIGLLLLAAIISVYTVMLRSNSDNLKMIRLNQDLRSLMGLMSRDIRRAGANRASATDATATPPTNQFSGITIAANQQGIANACITYAYYHPESSFPPPYTLTNNDLFGFRHNSTTGAIETRAAGAACNEGGWQTLSDLNLVNISALTFAQNTLTEGLITIRQITITLTGELRNDTDVTRTIVETIKIRNEEF